MTNAFVILIGCVAAIVFISIFASLGIIFICLNRTPFVKTIPLLSLIFLPVLLITGITHMGHIGCNEVKLSEWRPILTAGIIITIFVLVQWWRKVITSCFTPSMIFSIISGTLSLILFTILNATKAFAYNYLGNGEFLNYARLADFLIKNEKELPGFFVFHRSLRFGQDIFLAVLGDMFHKNPVELVHTASGYLFFGYASVVGFLVAEIFGFNVLSFLLMILSGLMLTPLFNYNVSFFSSTVIISSTILLLAFAGSRYNTIKRRPQIFSFLSENVIGNAFLLICLNVFLCITYPEFGLPIIGACFLLAAHQSFCCRRVSIPLLSLMMATIFLITFNMRILSGCVKIFVEQLKSKGGWNIFGHPLNDSTFFLLNISGLSYPSLKYSGAHIATNLLLTVLLLAGWFCLIYLFLKRGRILAHDQECGALLLWSGITVYTLVAPFIQGGSWYTAAKIFSQFSFGIIMILGFAFDLKSLEQEKKKPGKVCLSLMIMLLIMFSVLNLPQLFLAKKQITVYSYSDWTEQIKNINENMPLVVFDNREGELIWFAEIVAHDVKIKLKPITNAQVHRLERSAESVALSSCGTPVNYDLSLWPFNEEVLAIVNSQEGSSTKLRSDQGFDFSVTRHEVVASLGKSRLDRLKFGNKSDFTFNDWAVNGVWSASIGPFFSYASLIVNVPEPLIRAGPVDVIFDFGQTKQVRKVSSSGVHVFSVNAGSGMKYRNIFTVRTAETWSPCENDKSSSDTRRLGVQVLALSTMQNL